MATRFFLAGLVLALLPQTLIAHGGVVQEDDLCIIKVNYLRAHFKIYQPRASGHEQFCEDLPLASESVFVMEYQHDALASMPVDFRIIRDVTGKGRFARLEDVMQIDNIDDVTVFYQEPLVEPDVFSVVHEFDEEGDFIGIVSAKRLDTDIVYAAVFPFEVGFTGIGYWPLIITVLVLLQLQFLFMSGRLRRWFGKAGASSALLLPVIGCLALSMDTALAADQELRVTYIAPADDIAINKMQSWVLHVETTDGVPVVGAQIDVSGGMPQHNHGLPTRPRVTKELGEGRYQLDGMRFHMAGYWEITVTVSTADTETTVVIPLQL